MAIRSAIFALNLSQYATLAVAIRRQRRVIKLVEEADQHRADVQRLADRFATWYLPASSRGSPRRPSWSARRARHGGGADGRLLLLLCARDAGAMIASIGASARRGLLIKGGKYLESLAKADVVLLDTGTLTLGRPRITDVASIPSRQGDRHRPPARRSPRPPAVFGAPAPKRSVWLPWSANLLGAALAGGVRGDPGWAYAKYRRHAITVGQPAPSPGRLLVVDGDRV